jgi:uncharacterized protein YneF (UPF0154 family)
MSNIITLPQLQQLLIDITDSNESTVDNFLKEFFGLITETLAAGESVRIKNIGQFIPHGETEEVVEFIPDKEIAEAINLPFEAFEAVELNDEITEEILNNVSIPEAEPIAVPESTEEPIAPEEQISEEPVIEAPAAEESATEEPTAEQASDENIDELEPVTNIQIDEVDTPSNFVIDTTPVTPAEEETPANDVSDQQQNNETPESKESDMELENKPEEEDEDSHEYIYVYKKRSVIPYILIAIVCLLIGFFAGYFWQQNLLNKDAQVVAEEPVATDSIQEIATVEVPQEQPADTIKQDTVKQAPQPFEEVKPEPVYDTVSKSRYLTTMAREYYHNLNYWVYIYEENKDILPANPNKINPGTKVLIPPFEKYAKSKNDSVNLARAIAKADEIYAPFRKSTK